MPDTPVGGNDPYRDLLRKDSPELRAALRAEPDPETGRALAIRAELKRRHRAGARFVWFEGDVRIRYRPGDKEREGESGRRPN